MLRFATDSFMENFRWNVFDIDPMRLREFIARPETWRGPIAPVNADAGGASLRAGAAAKAAWPSLRRAVADRRPPAAHDGSVRPGSLLKLYQAGHQRYYLVISQSRLSVAGLPDRAIQTTNHERVTYVIRHLIPKVEGKRPAADTASADEFAYVTDASGTGWRRVPAQAVRAISPGEHQLPLFMGTYAADDGMQQETLAGLVPVGRRETYLHAAPLSDPADALATGPVKAAPAPQDARLTLLRTQVTEPWRQLNARRAASEATFSKRRVPVSPYPIHGPERDSARKAVRQQIQDGVVVSAARPREIPRDIHPRVWRHSTERAVETAAEESLANAIASTTYTLNGVPLAMDERSSPCGKASLNSRR